MKLELELKHIASYLPYGLEWKRNNDDSIYEVTSIDASKPHVLAELGFCSKEEFGIDRIDKGTPILRPLSSMTIEEIEELNSLIDSSVRIVVSSGNYVYVEGANSDPWDGKPTLSLDDINKINEYFFSKHFDVFRLIDKGLAIEKK